MLHYACLFMQNSCKLYTYSGKFPSLNRLCSGYGGKFLHKHLFPRRHFLPKLYPPLCPVSCTKNWTKLFGFLVCEIWRLIPILQLPPKFCGVGTPYQSVECLINSRKHFRKKSCWERNLAATTGEERQEVTCYVYYMYYASGVLAGRGRHGAI